MSRNSSTHYSPMARLLHWGMAALIVAGLAGVELHDLFSKGSAMRSALMATHFQAGLFVFLLVWPRITQHLLNRAPMIVPEPPRWQTAAAKLTHLALYLGMIALPILGMLMLQANGRTVALLGMPLPVFIGVDKEFSKELKEVHEIIGNLMIVLILVHAAAAVWHHKAQRDNTLLRMLPPTAGSGTDASTPASYRREPFKG